MNRLKRTLTKEVRKQKKPDRLETIGLCVIGPLCVRPGAGRGVPRHAEAHLTALTRLSSLIPALCFILD